MKGMVRMKRWWGMKKRAKLLEHASNGSLDARATRASTNVNFLSNLSSFIITEN